MNPALWRSCALLVIATACMFVAYDFLAPEQPDYGIHSAAAPFSQSGTGEILVTRVDPHSAAARAGIVPGDRIDTGETALARGLYHFAPPGARVPVRVNGKRTAVLTAPLNPRRADFVAGTVIRFAFLLVAALLAWRRPEDRAVRALCVFLVCYGVLIGLQNGIMPWVALSNIVLVLGSPTLMLAGTAAAAVFAALFPSGEGKPVPATAARLACGLAALGIVLACVSSSLHLREGAALFANGLFIAVFAAIGVLFAISLVSAYFLGSPAERPRRRWVFLMLGVGLLTVFIDVLLTNLVGYNSYVDNAGLLTIGCIPFGLAYAILRHRVIDVGFVLNRAVVYGVVSVVIVGVFVIVETLVSKYIERTSHIGSMLVELVVALALGFSIRAIHERVDRLVDTLLFRERHEAERAMREFAFDAHYITDRATLLERCIGVVRRYAGATAAGIWLRGQEGYVQERGTFPHAAVDENDPAIVVMRSRRAIANLTALDSALPGVLGFPMIVRGEVTGVLVCGPKNHDESYAPDERASLEAISSAVAHALDGLRLIELEGTVRRLLAAQPPTATGGTVGTF